MSTSLPNDEQEALFQSIIRKIPSIKDPGHLRELVSLAVTLMLRRPVDQDLRHKLTQCIHDIFTRVEPPSTSDPSQTKGRRIARDCVEVLQAAKEHRLPRDTLYHPDTRTAVTAKAASPPVHHDNAKPSSRAMTGRGVAVVIGLVVLAGLGGVALWYGLRSEGGGSTFEDAGRFSTQVMEAAAGSGASTHMFGGPLEVSSMNGVPVVIARGVPPRICAASGMRLVKKGLLSINGDTPTRISSAIVTELCNTVESGATIMWAPTK